MSNARNTHARYLLVWLTAFLVPVCPAGAAPVLALTPFDTHSKTVCIGRHQMALPADFEQSVGSVSVFTLPDQADGGAPISLAVKAARMDKAAFALQVDQRHSAILGAARMATDMLKQVIIVSTHARIFRINDVDDAYKDELHLWTDGVYLVASTASYENTYTDAEARLKAFAADIEVSASTPQAGFCLGPVVPAPLQPKIVLEFDTGKKGGDPALLPSAER